MKEEVFIRVESLKIELEEKYIRFCDHINEHKLKVKNEIIVVNDEIDKTLKSAKEMLEIYNNKEDESENKMYLFDKKINGLDKLENELSKTIQSLQFKPKEDTTSDAIIGELSFPSLKKEQGNEKNKEILNPTVNMDINEEDEEYVYTDEDEEVHDEEEEEEEDEEEEEEEEGGEDVTIESSENENKTEGETCKYNIYYTNAC
jgi:hypothetical protein